MFSFSVWYIVVTENTTFAWKQGNIDKPSAWVVSCYWETPFRGYLERKGTLTICELLGLCMRSQCIDRVAAVKWIISYGRLVGKDYRQFVLIENALYLNQTCKNPIKVVCGQKKRGWGVSWKGPLGQWTGETRWFLLIPLWKRSTSGEPGFSFVSMIFVVITVLCVCFHAVTPFETNFVIL